MDKVLQAGLAAGMSATDGIHKAEAKPPPPNPTAPPHLLPLNFIPTSVSRFNLPGARENISLPYMSIGAWSWGEEATFRYRPEQLLSIRSTWEKLFNAGVNYVDTAQAYGDGESERIIGQLVRPLKRDQFIIQPKWYVVPSPTNFLEQSKAPKTYLKDSLERLGLDYVDIYLVHGPIHPTSISSAAAGLADCVSSGMARAVGVCNYDTEEMLEMQRELAKYHIPLSLNQCEYSILRRLPETKGLLQACVDNGILFQGYSSLAMGRLSGKYDAKNEPPKTYRFSKYPMSDIEPTLRVLRRIAQAHDKPVSAVALNFNLSKAVIPLVGMRSPDQAEQNLQTFGWRLSDAEIREIEAVSLEGKDTVLWQHS